MIPFSDFKYYGFIADVFGITERCKTIEVEIKSSRQDYFNDFSKQYKHSHLLQGMMAAKFYVCCPDAMIKPAEVPAKYGLLYIIEMQEIKMIRKADFLHDRMAEHGIIHTLLSTAKDMTNIRRAAIAASNKCEIDQSIALNFKPKQFKNGNAKMIEEYNTFFK